MWRPKTDALDAFHLVSLSSCVSYVCCHDLDECHCHILLLASRSSYITLHCTILALFYASWCDVPLVILLHCIMIIMPCFAYLSFVVCSCVNPSYSYLHLIFLFIAHTSNNSSSSPKFLSHPNFSFSLSFNYFSSDIFCSRLMLTIFLYSLHHAKTTSSSFQVFWKCFGWAKDLFKLELFSNLFEFAVS